MSDKKGKNNMIVLEVKHHIKQSVFKTSTSPIYRGYFMTVSDQKAPKTRTSVTHFRCAPITNTIHSPLSVFTFALVTSQL